ncbi:hypothetical protein DL95DRAFT_180603 [Leptodontidium sp. 2 PMI_412]|nr:hypothetical protein DL95DRAFT_180603 [Leptodontidium sp. 2 PMI_412]
MVVVALVGGGGRSLLTLLGTGRRRMVVVVVARGGGGGGTTLASMMPARCMTDTMETRRIGLGERISKTGELYSLALGSGQARGFEGQPWRRHVLLRLDLLSECGLWVGCQEDVCLLRGRWFCTKEAVFGQLEMCGGGWVGLTTLKVNTAPEFYRAKFFHGPTILYYLANKAYLNSTSFI